MRWRCPTRRGCAPQRSTQSGDTAPPPPPYCTLRGHSMFAARYRASQSSAPVPPQHLPLLPGPPHPPPSPAHHPLPLPSMPAPARLTCRAVLAAPQGRDIRCAVGRLAVEVAKRLVTDVLIHPSVPSNRSLWGECTTRTMTGLRAVRRRQDAARRRADGEAGGAARGRRLQETWPARAKLAADDLRLRIPTELLWRWSSVNGSRVEAGATQPQP